MRAWPRVAAPSAAGPLSLEQRVGNQPDPLVFRQTQVTENAQGVPVYRRVLSWETFHYGNLVGERISPERRLGLRPQQRLLSSDLY